MAFRLPRLSDRAVMFDPKTGRPTQEMQRWWQSVVEAIEGAEDTAVNALAEAGGTNDFDVADALTEMAGLLAGDAEAGALIEEVIPDLDEHVVEQEIIPEPQQDVSDFIQFPSDAPYYPAARRLGWVAADGTAVLGLDADTTLPLGQKSVIYALNNSGASISQGEAVMYNNGALSDYVTIAKAVSSGAHPAHAMLGVAAEAIANGAMGYVVTNGIAPMDTTVWSKGDILYLNPSVAGGLSSVEPAAPNLRIPVGIVLVDAAAGSVWITMGRPDKMASLKDVQITTPANKHILWYDNANARWANIANDSFVFDKLLVDDSAFFMDLVGASANVNFDTNDYAAYDRSTNTFRIFIGGSAAFTLTASSMSFSGTVPVASGGTGASSFTSGYLVKGNGTSALSSSVVYEGASSIGIGTTTMTAKFNVSGASFVSGRSNFGDTAYYAELLSSDPVLNWEANSYDGFNRTSNIRHFTVGSNTLMTLTNQSDAVEVYINGSLKRLEVGAVDSGGTGYRMVRVLN